MIHHASRATQQFLMICSSGWMFSGSCAQFPHRAQRPSQARSPEHESRTRQGQWAASRGFVHSTWRWRRTPQSCRCWAESGRDPWGTRTHRPYPGRPRRTSRWCPRIPRRMIPLARRSSRLLAGGCGEGPERRVLRRCGPAPDQEYSGPGSLFLQMWVENCNIRTLRIHGNGTAMENVWAPSQNWDPSSFNIPVRLLFKRKKIKTMKSKSGQKWRIPPTHHTGCKFGRLFLQRRTHLVVRY